MLEYDDMNESTQDLMEKIVSLCKRRGFIFPGSEIYGGLAGTWDYGPYGVALRNNIKNIWWKFFVDDRNDMYGVDSAILMMALRNADDIPNNSLNVHSQTPSRSPKQSIPFGKTCVTNMAISACLVRISFFNLSTHTLFHPLVRLLSKIILPHSVPI